MLMRELVVSTDLFPPSLSLAIPGGAFLGILTPSGSLSSSTPLLHLYPFYPSTPPFPTLLHHNFSPTLLHHNLSPIPFTVPPSSSSLFLLLDLALLFQRPASLVPHPLSAATQKKPLHLVSIHLDRQNSSGTMLIAFNCKFTSRDNPNFDSSSSLPFPPSCSPLRWSWLLSLIEPLLPGCVRYMTNPFIVCCNLAPLDCILDFS